MSNTWTDLTRSDNLLGQVVTVSGSDPHDATTIERIVRAENGLLGHRGLWMHKQVFVLGYAGFDHALVRQAVQLDTKLGLNLLFLRQEDFENYCRHGINPSYTRNDPRVREHRGLSFLTTLGYRWPIVPADLRQIIAPARVSWDVLPPGAHPFPALVEHFARLQRAYPQIPWEPERIHYVNNLKPDQTYTGRDEFEGYVIFVFDRLNRAILECPIRGNAAYVIRENWATLSQLTKYELIWYHEDKVERIIHSGEWQRRLIDALYAP